MLDSGPVHLGQGYLDKGQLGPLQGVTVLTNGQRETHALPFGVQVHFQEIAEPESHVHPSAVDDGLWKGLPKQATWLWNGLRGGLIAPATGMELTGVKRGALLQSWQQRGADPQMIQRGRCHAYELEGYYEFSEKARDPEAIRRLKEKVKFLVEDAPALKQRVNPGAPVIEHDLGADYLRGERLRGRSDRSAGLVRQRSAAHARLSRRLRGGKGKAAGEPASHRRPAGPRRRRTRPVRPAV